MTRPIPLVALALTAAGVLPFLWGVATLYVPATVALTMDTLGPRFVGPFVSLQYGVIILCFMSGVLWGFAARDGHDLGPAGYALSVIPALWAFFFVGGGPVSSAINLMAGFVAVLALDWLYWRAGAAPDWWMRLRLPVTAAVLACLAPIAIS